MNPNARVLENLLVENFKTKKIPNSKTKKYQHEKSIAAQIEIVKHYFTTAWQMLNDSHNNTGSQALKVIRNYEYWNNQS